VSKEWNHGGHIHAHVQTGVHLGRKKDTATMELERMRAAEEREAAHVRLLESARGGKITTILDDAVCNRFFRPCNRQFYSLSSLEIFTTAFHETYHITL